MRGLEQIPFLYDAMCALMEWTGFAAAYHHRNEWQSLIHQQQIWVRLESFARQIHGTLAPEESCQAVLSTNPALLATLAITFAPAHLSPVVRPDDAPRCELALRTR